ncbi:MAG: phospholipase [Deltaproteobacteria bacterium]|nr:phospholipase [Deltaproteobacteria bacterium]
MSDSTIELLTGSALHHKVIQQGVLLAEKFVWIATANLKDMHIAMARGRYKPILEAFDEMAERGISFRIVHSDIPSKPFRNTLERFARLTGGALELQTCPRSHWKMVIVDGKLAYCGSANFTGAGLGAKSEQRRNLELGFFSDQASFVNELTGLFDSFWMGKYCRDCGRKDLCPDPIET